MRNKKGITLISLVVTIIILVILAVVTINIALNKNGIVDKSKTAESETIKEAATEKINLKITSFQIKWYTQNQELPLLQALANEFCGDEEIEYVELQSKKIGSLKQIDVSGKSSIFTKLKEYPYEFEINSSLQLASIDGIQVATVPTNNDVENNTYSTKEALIGTWIDGSPLYRMVFTGISQSKVGDYILYTFSNPVKVIDIKGYIMQTNGDTAFYNSYTATDYSHFVYYKISTQSIYQHIPKSAFGQEYAVIIEYMYLVN